MTDFSEKYVDSNLDSAFEKAAQGRVGGNVCRELWYFVCQNKKWWLVPILVVLLLLGALLLISGTAAAPFIYTLF
jgi:hypothetical protein